MDADEKTQQGGWDCSREGLSACIQTFVCKNVLSALADILGHSSIETTRIYTADSEQKYLASMERLELLLSDIRLPEEVTE